MGKPAFSDIRHYFICEVFMYLIVYCLLSPGLFDLPE